MSLESRSAVHAGDSRRCVGTRCVPFLDICVCLIHASYSYGQSRMVRNMYAVDNVFEVLLYLSYCGEGGSSSVANKY